MKGKPYLPMSLNRLIRASFWEYRKERDDITKAFEGCLVYAIPKAVGRRSVRIEIVKGSSSRKRDDACNRDGRSKAILDSLSSCGLIVDDSEEWLDHHPVEESRDKAGPYLVIEIEDISG